MTSRNTTGLLRRATQSDVSQDVTPRSDSVYRVIFGAISWPWLLYSLWGGTKSSKARLLRRLALPSDALPHLGSWKADTGFLHHIVDIIEEIHPETVVELGAGASTLVCARALQQNGGGRLISYDQHSSFVAATSQWLSEEGVSADVRHAPLRHGISDWPGQWYDLDSLPQTIDLLIIDGPPWAVHPFVRGAAEILFDRLSPGAVVLLDDAARPGERIVARRWRERWPAITFERIPGSTKGTLIGRKKRISAKIIPFPKRGNTMWQRAAASLALLATGWLAHDIMGPLSEPARAHAFLDEANASYAISVTRQKMQSQVETAHLDRQEIKDAAGLTLPNLPSQWQLLDVQLYPSDLGVAVAITMRTEEQEILSLFATRAETPAERNPLLSSRQNTSVAYWEDGPFAYALTGELKPARMLALAARLSETGAK